MTLEQQGLPTATIITDVFVGTAVAYTRMLGAPDFPYLVCAHPITNVAASELEARARLLAPQVRRLLLEGPRPLHSEEELKTLPKTRRPT